MARLFTKTAAWALLTFSSGSGVIWGTQHWINRDRHGAARTNSQAQYNAIDPVNIPADTPVQTLTHTPVDTDVDADVNTNVIIGEPLPAEFDVTLGRVTVPDAPNDGEYITVRLEDLRRLEEHSRAQVPPPDTTEQPINPWDDIARAIRILSGPVLLHFAQALEYLNEIWGLYNWILLLVSWSSLVYWWVFKKLGYVRQVETRIIRTQTTGTGTQSSSTEPSPPRTPPSGPPPSGPPSSGSSPPGPDDQKSTQSPTNEEQQNRIRELELQVEDLRKENQRLQDESTHHTEQQSAAQDEIARLTNAGETHAGQVQTLNTRIRTLQQDRDQLSADNNRLTTNNDVLSADFERQRNTLRQTVDQRNSLQRKLELERSHSGNLKSRNDEIEKELEKAQQTNETLEERIEDLEAQKDKTERDLENVQDLRRDNQELVNSLHQRLQRAQETGREQKNTIDTLQAQRAQRVDGAEDVERIRQEKQAVIDQREARIQELEGQLEGAQNMPPSEAEQDKDNEICNLKERVSTLEDEVNSTKQSADAEKENAAKQHADDIKKERGNADALQNQISTLQTEVDNSKRSAEAEKANSAKQHEDAIKEERSNVEALQKAVTSLQSQLHTAEDTQQKTENRVKDLEQRNTELQKQVDDTKKVNQRQPESHELSTQNDQLRQERDELSRQVQELTSARDELQTDLRSQTDVATRAANERDALGEQHRQQAAESARANLQERQTAEAEIRGLREAHAALEAQADEQVKEIQREAGQFREQAETLVQERDQQIAARDEEITRLQQQVKSLEEQKNAQDTEMEDTVGNEQPDSDRVSNEEHQWLLAHCAELEKRVSGYHEVESDNLILKARNDELEEEMISTQQGVDDVLLKEVEWSEQVDQLKEANEKLQWELNKCKNQDEGWDAAEQHLTDQESAEEGDGLQEESIYPDPTALPTPSPYQTSVPPSPIPGLGNPPIILPPLNTNILPGSGPSPPGTAISSRRMARPKSPTKRLQQQEEAVVDEAWEIMQSLRDIPPDAAPAQPRRTEAQAPAVPWGAGYNADTYMSDRNAFLAQQEQRARTAQQDEIESDEDEPPAPIPNGPTLAPTAAAGPNPLADTNQMSYDNGEDVVDYDY